MMLVNVCLRHGWVAERLIQMQTFLTQKRQIYNHCLTAKKTKGLVQAESLNVPTPRWTVKETALSSLWWNLTVLLSGGEVGGGRLPPQKLAGGDTLLIFYQSALMVQGLGQHLGLGNSYPRVSLLVDPYVARAQVVSLVCVCGNILWEANGSKAFYKAVVAAA